MSVSVLERVNPCWVEKADEPTGSVTKTRGGSVSAPASPSHHLGDNGAETKAHLLFSLGAPLLLCGARFCPRRSHSAFPYQPRLGFLCCCCGAFSLAVAASKINILLMRAALGRSIVSRRPHVSPHISKKPARHPLHAAAKPR
jgi:hypothetical protein